MGTQDPDYWQVGYGEWEIRTESGIALAVRGEAEPIYTITTWVPERHMRPEQLTGWTTPLVAEPEGILIAAGARPLPRISTSIHRKALGQAGTLPREPKVELGFQRGLRPRVLQSYSGEECYWR